MFHLFDLNMSQKELPRGVRPLDIVISSIGKETMTDTMEGVPGVIRYGSRDTTRNIDLKFFIRSDSSEHFKRIRNELFSYLSEPMYLVESEFSDRRYLIELSNIFTPTRFDNNQREGELLITVSTIDLPYAESIFPKETKSLSVYVDGNVRVEPYRQHLEIKLRNVEGSTSYLELRNTRNDSHFRITEAVNSSLRLDVEGVVVKMNGAQALRRTDKEFITLDPGMNELKLLGATSADATIIFRNYYK